MKIFKNVRHENKMWLKLIEREEKNIITSSNAVCTTEMLKQSIKNFPPNSTRTNAQADRNTRTEIHIETPYTQKIKTTELR